ncbi:hypothetical protein LshimejAT787_1300860 [Lyophyllum shimeji]|uniref:Uncharacterized protein n=1 Tax=Lyophyllum shimeji TaxID=47721 RepID=A0A9P3PUJ6_LYOSH|nr:hypothetical protein LshimejAT787_1300860 [Lyophyllum shimeji]
MSDLGPIFNACCRLRTIRSRFDLRMQPNMDSSHRRKTMHLRIRLTLLATFSTIWRALALHSTFLPDPLSSRDFSECRTKINNAQHFRFHDSQ